MRLLWGNEGSRSAVPPAPGSLGAVPSSPEPPSTPTRPARPALVAALVAAVALEAGLLVGVAAFYLVGIARRGATDVPAAAATAGLALVLAAALGLFARGLWAGRRWARAPIVTWNLLVIASLLSTGGWRTGLGVVVLVGSAAVVVGVLSPAVTRATASTQDPPVT